MDLLPTSGKQQRSCLAPGLVDTSTWALNLLAIFSTTGKYTTNREIQSGFSIPNTRNYCLCCGPVNIHTHTHLHTAKQCHLKEKVGGWGWVQYSSAYSILVSLLNQRDQRNHRTTFICSCRQTKYKGKLALLELFWGDRFQSRAGGKHSSKYLALAVDNRHREGPTWSRLFICPITFLSDH